jgi:hypothetical protein
MPFATLAPSKQPASTPLHHRSASVTSIMPRVNTAHLTLVVCNPTRQHAHRRLVCSIRYSIATGAPPHERRHSCAIDCPFVCSQRQLPGYFYIRVIVDSRAVAMQRARGAPCKAWFWPARGPGELVGLRVAVLHDKV